MHQTGSHKFAGICYRIKSNPKHNFVALCMVGFVRNNKQLEVRTQEN